MFLHPCLLIAAHGLNCIFNPSHRYPYQFQQQALENCCDTLMQFEELGLESSDRFLHQICGFQTCLQVRKNVTFKFLPCLPSTTHLSSISSVLGKNSRICLTNFLSDSNKWLRFGVSVSGSLKFCANSEILNSRVSQNFQKRFLKRGAEILRIISVVFFSFFFF